MKVLYIHRKMFNQSGWFNKRFKYLDQKLKRRYIFKGRYSFFRGSVHRAMDTTEKNIDYVKSVKPKTVNKRYDWMIISHEAHYGDDAPPDFHELIDVCNKFDIPKALFIGHDKPEYLPEESTLSKFDLIFKREPFKNLNKYDISDDTKEKIKPTILSCQFIAPNFLTINWVDPKRYGYDTSAENFQYDVFFSGRYASEYRRKIWETVKSMNILSEGGLYEGGNNFEKLPSALRGKKYDLSNYHKKLHQSRINICIRGAGPFTHRHLETWASSGFMLSDSSIEEIKLPFSLKKGEHYDSFKNTRELKNKISYYLQNKRERLSIARKGRELFEEQYSFEKHGNWLKQKMLKTI